MTINWALSLLKCHPTLSKSIFLDMFLELREMKPIKNTCIEVKIADTSYVGLHRFCNISKQMPPSAYTFGWNIFDTKRTVGGLLGYSSVNSMVNLNVPSSNGVSCGPNITAFHIMILLSVGAPETPVGGSSWSLQINKTTENNWKKES